MFKISVTIIHQLSMSGLRELGHKAYKHFCIHYFWMRLCEKWENWAHEVNTKRGRTAREIQHRMEEVLEGWPWHKCEQNIMQERIWLVIKDVKPALIGQLLSNRGSTNYLFRFCSTEFLKSYVINIRGSPNPFLLEYTTVRSWTRLPHLGVWFSPLTPN